MQCSRQLSHELAQCEATQSYKHNQPQHSRAKSYMRIFSISSTDTSSIVPSCHSYPAQRQPLKGNTQPLALWCSVKPKGHKSLNCSHINVPWLSQPGTYKAPTRACSYQCQHLCRLQIQSPVWSFCSFVHWCGHFLNRHPPGDILEALFETLFETLFERAAEYDDLCQAKWRYQVRALHHKYD